MKCLINSTVEDVAKKSKIGYQIIERILERQIDKTTNWTKLDELEIIGIDEIASKKGHDSYFTVVSSMPTNSGPIVLAVLDGREKKTVKTFLESIPPHLKKTVKHVCTDMYDGFVNAAIEVFGAQRLVIDRYHVVD